MYRIIRAPYRLMINSDSTTANQSTQISLHFKQMPQQKNAEGHALVYTIVESILIAATIVYIIAYQPFAIFCCEICFKSKWNPYHFIKYLVYIYTRIKTSKFSSSNWKKDLNLSFKGQTIFNHWSAHWPWTAFEFRLLCPVPPVSRILCPVPPINLIHLY